MRSTPGQTRSTHASLAPRGGRIWIFGVVGLLCAFIGVAIAQAAPTTQPAATAPATQPAPVPRNLFAHGNNKFLWMATVVSMPEGSAYPEQTRIDFRPAGRDDWQHLTELPARAIALGNLEGQAAILLDGGDWKLQDADEDGSTGEMLPGRERIVTFCSDADSLWAVGVATSATVITTQPATTQSTTNPAETFGPGLTLFTRKENKWTPAGGPPIPDGISANDPISLAVIDNAPCLAVERADHTVEVLRQMPAGWQSIARVPAGAQGGAFKLLGGLSPTTLWVAGPAADVLQIVQAGGAVKTVQLKETGAPVSDRTAFYAVNAIRELAIVDGKLLEQDYDPQTYAAEKKTTKALPANTSPPMARPLFEIGLFVVLSLAIFSSARRRRDLQEAAPELGNLALADLLRRLAAGLIDAVPFIAPIAVVLQSIHNGSGGALESGNAGLGNETYLVFIAAMFIYLLHTAASETLTTRTLGKWIMGLRVVRLDGTTPEPSALLMRNFLRVVDIGLMGIPLVFIAFSPLRQRIGDVAAGTVVIRDRVKPEGNLIEPVKAEPATRIQSDPEPPPAQG